MVGPWLSEICFAFWWIACVFLSVMAIRHKSLEAAFVLITLTALMALGNLNSMWLQPFFLMLAHILIATAVFVGNLALNILKNGYGDWLLTTIILMAFFDVIFYVTGFPIQYHVWILDLLFIAICSYTVYATHNNKGQLGGNHSNPQSYSKGYH